MEESVSRDTHPWKIIIAWVIVLIPRLWARYQQGSVQREKRQSGPDVWIFRWREAGLDGSGKVRKAIVGRSKVSLPRQQHSGPLKRATQSKVVRMMVSSAGTKVANVGTTDSKKQGSKCRIGIVLCPDFVVTLGPYSP